MKQRDHSTGEAFSEGEERFQAIWQVASDAMVLSRSDGTVFAANPAYYHLYGYSPEEVLGKDYSIIFPLEQREWAHKLYSFITHNDTRTAMLSIIRDITERKKVEEALRDSKLKLHLALKLAHMATWEWEIASDRIYWSANLEIAMGFAPGTFCGYFKDFLRVVHPEDQDLVEREMRRALAEGADYKGEFRAVRTDGAVYWSVNRGQVIYDDAGKPARMS